MTNKQVLDCRLFCFGFGQSVAEFVRLYRPARVAACIRSVEKRAFLLASGVDAYHWNANESGLDEHTRLALQQADMIIVSAPPSGQNPFFSHVVDDLCTAIARQDTPPVLVYLSSTNVYGDRDGQWVDETAPLLPSSVRGVARAQAEVQWQSVGARAHVLRLAGIYGQRRNQILKLQSGKARRLIKPGHVFNRIHEADIAQAIAQAWLQPAPGVYNVADDVPAPPQRVLEYAAQLCDVPLPTAEDFADATLQGLAREFYRDNKRIRNVKLKAWLHRPLQFPNYKVGLSAIWQTMQDAKNASEGKLGIL